MTTSALSSPVTSAVRPLGAAAALGALGALLLGGSLMAVPTRDLGQLQGWLLVIAVMGPAALAAISVFDMFTVPALHQSLSRKGPVLILVATGCALVGDLLGVIGRLTQLSAVVSTIEGRPEPWPLLLDLLQRTLNTGGFLLVSISFSAFGILFVRARSAGLGWVAVAAGVLTAAGQVPGLTVLFYLANAAFLAWYVGLVFTLRRSETP